MQPILDFESTEPTLNVSSDSTALAPVFRDSAFEDNKTTSIHRWVPWIAGFSANFVHDAFKHYIPKDVARPAVLEPFAGVGTTLVESILSGYDAVGFEVNPFAYLASKVKCHAHLLSLDAIDDTIEYFRIEASKRIGAVDQAIASSQNPLDVLPAPDATPPSNFRSRTPFFSPIIQVKVLHCIDIIRSMPLGDVRELFLLAFGAILVGVSNYSYEPSLGSRAAAGRSAIEDDDVADKLLGKVATMRYDIEHYAERMRGLDHLPKATVYNSSSLCLDSYLPPQSVDLVATSPPYLNNYHYIRNTRPHLYWLDFVASSAELKAIEHSNFGKFWQTVRELPPMKLTFDDEEINDLISSVATRNSHKGIYGGQGWANYAVQYFNDCNVMCEKLKYILKPGAYAVYVLGNSVVQGVEIPTDRIFGRIAELNGLELADIHLLRSKRVGNSVLKAAYRNGQAEGAYLYETAVAVRQPEV